MVDLSRDAVVADAYRSTLVLARQFMINRSTPEQGDTRARELLDVVDLLLGATSAPPAKARDPAVQAAVKQASYVVTGMIAGISRVVHLLTAELDQGDQEAALRAIETLIEIFSTRMDDLG